MWGAEHLQRLSGAELARAGGYTPNISSNRADPQPGAEWSQCVVVTVKDYGAACTAIEAGDLNCLQAKSGPSAQLPASCGPAAGISGGLVRLSVGLTGSQAQVRGLRTLPCWAIPSTCCIRMALSCCSLGRFALQRACPLMHQRARTVHLTLRCLQTYLLQRWAQLEESYRHVAGVPLTVKPAFKAVQVRPAAF